MDNFGCAVDEQIAEPAHAEAFGRQPHDSRCRKISHDEEGSAAVIGQLASHHSLSPLTPHLITALLISRRQPARPPPAQKRHRHWQEKR